MRPVDPRALARVEVGAVTLPVRAAERFGQFAKERGVPPKVYAQQLFDAAYSARCKPTGDVELDAAVAAIGGTVPAPAAPAPLADDQQRVAALERSCAGLKAEKSKLERSAASLTERVSRLTGENARLEREIAQLRADDKRAIQAAADPKIRELTEQLELARQDIAARAKRSDENERRFQERAGEVAHLGIAIHERDLAIAQLRADLAAAQAAPAPAPAIDAETAGLLQRKSDEITGLRLEVDRLGRLLKEVEKPRRSAPQMLDAAATVALFREITAPMAQSLSAIAAHLEEMLGRTKP